MVVYEFDESNEEPENESYLESALELLNSLFFAWECGTCEHTLTETEKMILITETKNLGYTEDAFIKLRSKYYLITIPPDSLLVSAILNNIPTELQKEYVRRMQRVLKLWKKNKWTC